MTILPQESAEFGEVPEADTGLAREAIDPNHHLVPLMQNRRQMLTDFVHPVEIIKLVQDSFSLRVG